MKKLLFVFLLASFSYSYSQTLDFLPRGLGIEFGLGYNQLRHQEIPVAPFFSSESLTRNEFKVTPTFRLSWEKEIINDFSIMPLISYSVIGGKSEKMANGYQNEFLFKTLDLGLLASYKFYLVTVSFGGKYNRFLDVTSSAYGSALDPANTNRSWNENDASGLFKKWSIDLGGRTSYSINNFTFALEGWFNITELAANNLDSFVDVNSNRFQLLLGYRL
jgi:hypothetical protein